MIETKEKILTGKKFPFCPGCGHGIAIRQLAKVLQDLGYKPKDLVIVSDIGCSGLIDPLFATHTIHGLHGRSPDLGLGVAMGLNEKKGKKVITFIGDGGATIGLQHILEAARRNVDMTLIVLNNLVYGMTGGQISGLSTAKYKEIIDFEKDVPQFDIVKLAHASGARYAARVNTPKQIV
jgi:pyruvate/2-oxoacid:ferredoxin oxidoreductase beta subunit